jgi:hypothetical protein
MDLSQGRQQYDDDDDDDVDDDGDDELYVHDRLTVSRF